MRVGARQLAPGAMRLMLSGFGPRLCVDYIRDGIDGDAWNATMALVEQVLRSLDEFGTLDAEARVRTEAEVTAAVTKRLVDVGFAKVKLEELIAGLLEAYLESAASMAGGSSGVTEVDVEAGVGADGHDVASHVPAATKASVPAVPPISPEQELLGLLSIVLLPDGWFTVLDATTQTKHWVRVKAYYPAQHSVLLGHYMEARFLKLRTGVFATELGAGRIYRKSVV